MAVTSGSASKCPMVGQGLPVAQQVEEATDETGKRGALQTPLSLLSPSLTAMTIKASISVIFPNLIQILVSNSSLEPYSKMDSRKCSSQP